MDKPGTRLPPTPMRIALTTLLDSVAGSRKVLRNLAAVEHDLARKDGEGRFLFNAPAERLRLVRRELDGLLGASPPPGLAALRVRVLDALKTRERAELQEALRQPVSSFFGAHKLEVTEIGEADFERLQAEWNPDAVAAATHAK